MSFKEPLSTSIAKCCHEFRFNEVYKIRTTTKRLPIDKGETVCVPGECAP